MTKEDREYLILKSIKEGQDTIRQRDIAKIAGVSLGMTNSIIKKLIDKGLLRAKQITSKNIKYLLTPEGLTMVTRRGGDFLKRTVRNVVVFNESIDIIVKSIRSEGYSTINLVGDSDVTFLLHHSCTINKMDLSYSKEPVTRNNTKNLDAQELGQEVLDAYLSGAVLS